ncbi:MAG: YciI family protein [Reyranellaceae bacterium]
MAKFMLLLRDNPRDFTALSPAEMQAIIARYRAWSQGLREAGKLVGGDKLRDDPGKVLHHGGTQVTVKDGPYAESKELIGGYFLVEAPDYAAACEIARGCPHVRPGATGTIEVREIQEM